jgi:hypothetical protein
MGLGGVSLSLSLSLSLFSPPQCTTWCRWLSRAGGNNERRRAKIKKTRARLDQQLEVKRAKARARKQRRPQAGDDTNHVPLGVRRGEVPL